MAPLSDPLSILCDSWGGNLTRGSPSHPIIVTHSCLLRGWWEGAGAGRFRRSAASPGVCLSGEVPAPGDFPRLPYSWQFGVREFHTPLPWTQEGELRAGWQALCLQPAEDQGPGLQLPHRCVGTAGVRDKQLWQQDATRWLCENAFACTTLSTPNSFHPPNTGGRERRTARLGTAGQISQKHTGWSAPADTSNLFASVAFRCFHVELSSETEIQTALSALEAKEAS